jgi:hypothetical protein
MFAQFPAVDDPTNDIPSNDPFDAKFDEAVG